MSESQLWSTLKRSLDERKIFAERLTERFNTGIPDSFWIVSGITNWVELKEVDKVTSKIDITEDQIAELYRLHKRGAPAWCLIRVTKPKSYYLFGSHGRFSSFDNYQIPLAGWKRLAEPSFLTSGAGGLLLFYSADQTVDHIIGLSHLVNVHND